MARAVKITFAEFGAVFEGKLSSDGTSIAGTLNQLIFCASLNPEPRNAPDGLEDSQTAPGDACRL